MSTTCFEGCFSEYFDPSFEKSVMWSFDDSYHCGLKYFLENGHDLLILAAVNCLNDFDLASFY